METIRVTPDEVRAARIEVQALRSAGLTPERLVEDFAALVPGVIITVTNNSGEPVGSIEVVKDEQPLGVKKSSRGSRLSKKLGAGQIIRQNGRSNHQKSSTVGTHVHIAATDGTYHVISVDGEISDGQAKDLLDLLNSNESSD